VGLEHRGTTHLTYAHYKRTYKHMKRKERKIEEKSLGTRYPLDLLSDLKDLAEQDGRSFNGKVIWILRDSLRQRIGNNASIHLRSSVCVFKKANLSCLGTKISLVQQ